MISKPHLQAGQIDAAARALQEAIRLAPELVEPRLELFDLLCLRGEWERAAKQLSTLAQLDQGCAPLQTVFAPLVREEGTRSRVFAGEMLPMIFGEPAEWMAPWLQGARMLMKGEARAALPLINEARAEIQSTPGRWQNEEIKTLEDADPRIGPFLEVFINGRYFWLPWMRLRSIACSGPKSFRDVCWLPVQLTLANEGEIPAFIPARYPGSERSADPEIVLGRAVEWQRPFPDGPQFPTGQRVFTSGERDFSIFTLRNLSLDKTDDVQFADAPANSI